MVWSDFLTSISYALEDVLEDSVVVQTENEGETENVENEEENVEEEDSEVVYEDESTEEELETENPTWDIVEEWTWEVSEIGSWEIEEITEETVEWVTWDIVEELTLEIVESTGTGEESVIEEIKYNEDPIIWEKTYNDVIVRVEALSWIFPEWTELTIKPIKWWNLSSLKDKLVEEKEEIKEDTTIVAFDITFKYEWEEVQPKDWEKVKVTFDYSHNEDLVKADKNENQEVSVYHIDDETNEGTEIDIVNKDGDEVEILATEFSIYAVIKSNLPDDTITIRYDANGWIFKWWVTTKTVTYTKDANNLYVASENVQAPNKSWKYMFDGWYTDTTYATEWYGVANDTTTTSKTVYARWLPFEDLPAVTASDGTKYILMDRNLWATDVWNYGESETSAAKNGKYYQWWNNYGFSASNGNWNPYPYTSNMSVDASWYWPGNYYSSATFILIDYRWDDADNANLWWWNWDTATADWPSTTEEGRQWPCPSWYHVPSTREWKAIYNALGVETNNSGSIATLQKTLHLPKAGGRYNNVNTSVVNNGTVGNYRSSSPNIYGNLGPGHAPVLNFSSSRISSQSDSNCSHGYSVRCFKNSPTYTLTLVPNNWSGNITVDVYGDTVDERDIPTPTKDGYNFSGWYLTWAESAFDFTGTAITWDITLYAKWLADFVRYETIDDVDVNVNINAKWWTFPEGTELFIELVSQDRHDEIHTALVNDMGKNLELLAFDIYFMSGGVKQQPTTWVLVKLNYEGNPEFQWASLSDLSLYHIDGTTHELEPIEIVSKNGDEIEFWATEFSEYLFVLQEWEYIVSFVSDDVEVWSGIAVSWNVYTWIIPTPTKDGYNFSGWYLTWAESAFDFSGTAITGDITLYAKWEEGEGVMYTITFDANRWTFANLPTPQSVASGSLISAPTQQQTPELPWYTFTGWWTEPRGGTQWDFGNDLVTGNITLYAHWIYDLPYGDLDVYMIDSNGSLIKYVMMDRNLWATGVYNKNFDSQNPSSFGFVYQWWNNYGFPRCNGNGTCNYSPITDTQVSVDIVENYIPSKFASSTWIWKNWSNGSKKSWYVSDNTLNHLWWNANTTDRQWPCPDGYHVPLTSETNDEGWLFRVWGNIYDKTINRIEGNWSWFSFLSDDQKLFTFQFLLPNAWAHKKGNTKEQEQNMCWDYWTATPSGREMARNMWFCKDGQSDFYKKHGNFLFTNNSQRNNWSTLRCFKNSTDSANLDIVNWWKKGLITVHKVDGVTTINAIKEPENTDANWTGLIFGGWYTSQNFEPSTMKTWGDTLSASVTTLYAKWDCPDGLVYNSDNECISWVLVRFMDGETEYTRSVVISWEEVSAPAINPIKAWHIFTWWFESWANLPFVFTGTPITWNLDLYAHWEDLPETEALITVNYYLKNLDVENNKLTGGVIKYSTWVEFIWEIGDTINISWTYLTWVVWYYFDHATVFSWEDEILADEIYLEGNKEVNMYYIPEQNQFTLNTVPYSSTEWSSTGGMYYYGAKVILSGASSDDHYLWSGWDWLPEWTPNSAQTDFFMPNSEVTVTSSVREKIYDEYTVTFENRNGSVLWSGKVISGEIPVYSWSQPSRPATEETVYIFTWWYPELHPATHDETYIAVYTEWTRYYTVTLTWTPAWYGTLSPESLSGEYGAAIVISWDKLTVGWTEVILTWNEWYEFQEWTGTCGKVGKQVCDEFTVYSHPEPIEFTGGNNLIITDPGYDLFSESNYQKDFEISFDIVDQDLSSSVNQATILNVKDEDQENIYPGFAIRKSSSAGKIEITATSNYWKGYKTNKNYSLENLHSIKISRINSILYVSINWSENEQLYDYSGFNNYFTKPIIFGSSYQSWNMFRPAKITLSNILIKTIDTTSCYTWNVYVVTWDCQMTAKYANWTPSKYEVTGSVAAWQENMWYLSWATSTGTSLTWLYNLWTNLVVIAVPTLGYLFDYWEVNGFTGDNLPEWVTTSENQLTIIVNQILDIIAHFKPSNHTPYTVEHYKQNVWQTWYDFEWSGTMYWTTNASTNATGIDYEWFTLSGNLVDYQTWINADWSTVIRLYYDRNVYTITWNNWNGSGITTTPAVYGAHPEFARDGWPQRYRADDEVQYLFIFTWWSRSGSSEIIRELTGLTTEIVTGDTTYIAQYDQTYRSFEVRYHPNEWTGNMENQTFQLYTSWALNSNNFIRTGYEFDGWLYYYADDATGFYENGQTINIEKDYVKWDRERELGLLYFDLYAQWKPSTDTKFTVNCYTRELDKNYKVLSPDPKYLTWKQYTWKTDSGIRIGDYRAECLIDWYNIWHGFSGAILYGSDLPSSWVETWDWGNTTILADGTRRIDVYIAPKLDRFVINLSENCWYKWDPSWDYYYGSKIYLEANPFECYSFSWWIWSGLPDWFDRLSPTTTFFMPHVSVLTVTPTVKENTYNITFSGNGSTSWTMSNLSVLCTSWTLSQNAFEREWYTFAGWSENPNWPVQFTNKWDVHRLSIESGWNVTLYAIWDINSYDVTGSVATWQENMWYLSWATATGTSLTWLYEYWTELIFIAVPELGYLFDYWEVNNGTGDNLPDGAVASWNQLTVIVDQILDIVAHFKENVGTVTVNYYNMNTWWVYLWVTSTATFTWLVWYTGYATVQPPVGFYLDTTSTVNTWIVISENNAENVINIYYARNKHNITLGYAVAFLNPGSVTVIPTPRESGYYYWEDVHFEAIVSTWYVFKQWRVNGVPVAWGANGVDFIMWDEDVELVVDWDLITYNIDYYTDPWSTDPMNPNPQTYTVLSGEIEIHNPIAEFCNDFLWWTWGTTWDWILTPTTWLVIDSSKWWDRKYYANWERKSYEVELSVDPSSWWTVTWEGTYRCMGEIELHATPNTWYHFVGWYDTWGNIVSSNSMYFFRGPVGSLWTWLTAKFERNQYYITIDKNGSWHFWWESAPSGRYYHGTPITFFASPSYGYKIQKWSKNRQNITTWENDQLYTWFILDVIVTETGNYEVYFEPETYNIIYMDSGSILTWLSPATYTIENHVYSGDLPSITKDGYNFAGWFYEYPRQPENQIQEIWYVPVDGQSVTILAWWMPIDYNINYHLLTWVEIIPWEEYYPYEFYQSYNIETTRTDLPNVQKSGYIFSGWVDYHGKSFTGFGWWMTWDLDLYPTWRSDVMDITVNYYEMNTWWEYYPSSWAYYETYHYTWFTNSEFIAPDYTTTGFHLDWNKHPNGNPSIVISWDKNVNIIDVYYEREKYYLERVWLESCIDNDCITFATVTPDTWSIYYWEEIRADIQYNEWWSFSGWYNDDYNNMQLPDEVDDLTSEHIVFHMPARNVKIYPIMDHILYKLIFTGYEWAEVTNSDVAYASLTGENYYRFDSEIELPYLDKPWYNFIWWNSWDYNIWSIYYSSNPNHPIRHMPSHDVELTAVFEPKTNMEYNEYYYLQDVEWTGYSRDDELTQRKYDWTTEQQIPYPYPQKYITWFEYTWFGYDEKALRPWEEWPIIKATWDNYINYYYDRKVDWVYVEYDNKKMFITWTGEYRYGAPVNLIAVVKTGYEFSGFTSYQGELLSSESVYNFTMPDSYVYLYADANPIVYSIDYEMNWGHFVPYDWAKTWYTVDWDFDLDIFDAGKEWYTFLWWTWGVIWVRELTEPTTWLIIPLWSTWNRKYFANFEATWSNVTVNYYLKKIDPENNVLTWGVDEYISKWVVYTWLTDSVVDIHTLYGTGIEWYEYTTAIVYGSDSMDWIETGTTTILWDGTRSIDIYYTPKKYNFTVIQWQNTTTAWTSISTWYYYGAYVTLSWDSTDDCFEWDKWWSQTLPEWKNQQHTTFEMPAHNVTVESMVSEKSYNIVFDANGGTWTMSTLSVQCTTWTLSPNNFERNWYTFTGWSRNSGWPVEFTWWSNIHRLSTTSGWEVTLFAIWDFNEYTVTGTVAEWQENMWYLSWSTATWSSLTWLYDYGTELIFIAVPELGYLFDYWEVNWWTGDNLPDWVSISENQLTVVVDQILDIVAHFTENAKTVTVNYYEMNTGWLYSWVTNSTTFTGLVWHTGYATVNLPYWFHLDTTQTVNTWIVISNNDSENVINIYYARNQHQLNKFYSWDFQYNYNLVDFNPVLKQYYYYGEHIYTNVIVHTWYSVNNLTCSGWNNINIHGTEIEFDMWNEDATIIIDGSKNRYRIDYYLDWWIENPAEPNVTGYTIIDWSIQIHDPIKTGYNFLWWTGWMSGDWISTPRSWLIIDVENGLWDRQYYANWELKPYIVNVTIDPENWGTVRWTGEYHYGETFSLMATPNLWYDFTWWYTYEWYNKISDDYSLWLRADDSWWTGLIAKFELRNYLVHISSTPYKWSSRPQWDNYYQHWSLITVTAEPYEWYNVKNWMVNGRERKTWDNERYTGLTLDITITDHTNIDIDFEPKPYNITYMSGDTILTWLSPNTYDIETPICDVNFYNEYGTCMYYLPTLTRDGYDFTGWYNNPRISSYDRIEVLSWMWDRTIYAWFIPIIYRVYYHLWSWETLPEWYIDNYDEYTIESWRTYLPEPKKQGYDFLWWKNDNNQIITGFGWWMTWNLDLYPVWTGKVMDIEVRYYEMDINWNYNYYTHYDYTGITNSVFNVPDYTTTGFILDWTMHPSWNPSIVVSWNNDANIIDVYYEREEYEITTWVSEHGSVSGETGSQRYGKVITFTAHPEIGYILDKWFKNGEEIEWETWSELILTVEEWMEISGHFIASTWIEYRVEYYYQNAEDGSYPSSATSGEIRKWTTDTIAEVMTGDKNPTVSGYSFDSENEKNVLSGNINGSGDLVLKVYFKKQFTVKYLTWDKGLFDIEIYEWLDYSGNTPEFVGNTWNHMSWYTFNGWQPEVSDKVTKDENYVAQWIANTGTEYKVEYYKEKLEGWYDVWTWIQYGTSDTEWVAQELSFTWFTYDSWNVNNVTTWNIDWDGSRVLVMYYIRNMNNVVYVYTWKVPSGQVAPAISGYKYEAEVSVESAPSVSWYNFSWSTEVSSFIMPDEEVTITGTWTVNTWTKYAVKHMLQNVEDDEYTQTWENQILSWETDELTDAQANSYTWFVAQAVTQTWIRWDESTVVEIYYDREIYEVTTWESEHGSISGETGNQRYGKVITFTAHPEIGYVVSRWLRDGEEILRGWEIWTGEEIEIEVDTWMEISVEFKAREDTPYYVEYYKENLDGWYDVWTWIQYGTSDTEWVAQELSFTWFTYDSWNVNNVITWNIDWDGSKVLKMYYNREIYTITWLNEDWTDMDTTTVKYGEVPTHADPTQPADAHYTYKFKGWNPEPTFATGEISYRATYEHIVNKHTITWKNDDGSVIDKTMVEYGTIPTHAKPTKTETEDYRYIFARWDPEVVAVVWDAEYTAVFNTEEKEKSSKWGGMSGWGWRWWNIDNSDNQHWSAEENIDWDEYTWDEVVNDTDKNIVPLYKRVHENDITTMDTLEYADPDWLLTRWHLAKMVVNYMVNVLWRKIPYDVTYNCRYWGDDESSRESDEIRDYATKACAFWVMWINMEDNKFLPNSIVTRAEFWTVMSRVLRWDKYDITDTDNRSYYENHLQALKKDNILTQIANPETRWEIRKWVWLVFRRIVEKYKK